MQAYSVEEMAFLCRRRNSNSNGHVPMTIYVDHGIFFVVSLMSDADRSFRWVGSSSNDFPVIFPCLYPYNQYPCSYVLRRSSFEDIQCAQWAICRRGGGAVAECKIQQ